MSDALALPTHDFVACSAALSQAVMRLRGEALAAELGSIARALLLMSELHGMSRVARACGMRSDAMRRQLDGTRPLYFETVLGVSRALGVQLRAEAGQ